MASNRDSGEMADGKKHGYWITYYANGLKRSEGTIFMARRTDLGFITTKTATYILKPSSVMISMRALTHPIMKMEPSV